MTITQPERPAPSPDGTPQHGPRPRRRPRLVRAAPLIFAATASFVGGAIAGAQDPRLEREVATRYGAAWQRGDYAAMHVLLSDAAQRRYPLERFSRLHRGARDVATVQGMTPGLPGPIAEDGGVVLPVSVATRVFGTVRGDVDLDFTTPKGADEPEVEWAPEDAFPGLRRGEELGRRTTLPERAEILTRDGETLAEGDARTSALGTAAGDVAGELGPIPAERRAQYERLGFPGDATVGLTGLEREFDLQLAGVPGGTLSAGDRVLASAEPRRGAPVRASIDSRAQSAAVTALAGRLGGAVAMDPATGEILALAGIATSAPQPPGSTFKIITLAGALEAGIVKRSDKFPVATSATIEGVELENADAESCGGTLRYSFAHSCNSVFGPMGAELGAERLVAAAEELGFNADPPIDGAAPSTLPEADEIGDDLAVASTAIGQGKVLATPLQMASVAATIAQRGVQVLPTLGANPEVLRSERRIPEDVARTVAAYMLEVVRDGTGGNAAIEGVEVAGKTGTAELRSTQGDAAAQQPEAGATPIDELADTDAWFVSFAPYDDPRVAVAVMLVGQGRGGDTAAPVAREVMLAALRKRG